MEEQSGINTDLGSVCSKIAFGWAKKTFSLRDNLTGRLVPTVDGSYSSMLDFNGVKIGISSDGIGTKIEIAERMQEYSTLGFDLAAMTIDDLACNGFTPAFLSNILDVDRLDQNIIDDLMSGLVNACEYSKVTITGGEIAELGARIGGYGDKMHFNWCATAIGMLHPSLQAPITGHAINPGDVVLSVYNPGFRSNGFSLMRKILTGKYGEYWHNEPFSDSFTWGAAALTPCLIYSPLVTGLLDASLPVKGVAHITGGGVVDNLGRMIKVNRLGCTLDNLWEPDAYLAKVIELGNVAPEKAYRYWNMGNGLLIVVDPREAETALKAAEAFPQYKMKSAGVITAERVITIETGGTILRFTSFENK